MNLTTEDAAIIHDHLAFGQTELSERGEITRGDERDAKAIERLNDLGAKPKRRGDWCHNFYWATRGLSESDTDEIWYSRLHSREPEFE